MSQFGFFDSEDPAPPPSTRVAGLRAWPGCDTASEEWRGYCEAHGCVIGDRARNMPGWLGEIERARGRAGRLILEAYIDVFKRDRAGEVHPRSNLTEILRSAAAAALAAPQQAEVRRRSAAAVGTRRRR